MQAEKDQTVLTETIDGNNEDKVKLTGAQIAEIIGNAIYVLIQATILILFSCGAVNLLGERVTLITPINYIIKIFNLNSATAYFCIVGAMLGVVYAIMIVVMVRYLYASIRQFVAHIRFVFGNNKVENKKVVPQCKIFNTCMCTLYVVFSFVILANLVYKDEQPSAFIVCMVFGGVAMIAKSVVQCMGTAKNMIFNTIVQSIKQILAYVAICIIISLLKQAAIKELVDGVKMLFNGGIFNGAAAKAVCYSLYVNLISPALFFVVGVQVIMLFYDNVLAFYEESGKVLTRLIFILIIMALNLIFRTVLGMGNSSVGVSMFIDWFNFNKTELLPLCFIYILLLILGKIDKIKI